MQLSRSAATETDLTSSDAAGQSAARAALDLSAGESPPRPAISGRLLIGFGWAGLSVLIFAGWFVVTRLSVTHELRYWDVTALRFGIGAVLLAPVLLRRRRRLNLAAWRYGFVFMLLWGAPFVLLVALGLQLTSAGQAASIAPTMMPVFAGFLAWAVNGEKQGWVRWTGYGVIVLGIVMLLAAGAATHGAPNPEGLGALILAAAMWAVYTLLFRRSGLTAAQAAALICVWSAIVFLPLYLLLGLSNFGAASAGEIALQAGYQGVLMSAVAIVVFNRAVSILGAGAATAIIAFLPAVATLLAIPVLGEVPGVAEGFAIAVVVAGALLAARPRLPDSRRPDLTLSTRNESRPT